MDFNLFSYDCIGFDLDYTICRYKIASMVKLEYNALTKFLIEKGYPSEIFKEKLDENDLDFLQRGLLLDFKRGNIIKLSKHYTVLKAFHGTTEMKNEDIISSYPKRQIDFLESFIEDMTAAWEPENQKRYRFLLDYFDMPASLVFANCIDFIDSSCGEYEKCGHDILESLRHVYSRENFDRTSEYFKAIKTDPGNFIMPCSKSVLNFLEILKDKKITFLITGSNADYAKFAARYSLGENWQEYFSIIICYAQKPMFFKGENKFYTTENFQETKNFTKPKLGEVYSRGNWKELYNLFSETICDPKCIYFGDNIAQDIYTPMKYDCCDTIAIAEEIDEDYNPILKSNTWGSMFDFNSLWANIIRDNSKMYLPDIQTLASSMEQDYDIVEY